jgi:spore coat polysaccharide biosynthesis protein SpsF
MKPRVVCIIPARSDSRRFPRKHLELIGQNPMIGLLILRMKSLKLIDEVVVATTKRKCDDELISVSKDFGAKVFRGSLEDVIGRFAEASREYETDVCVKANGDNPLQCPEVIDLGIKQLLSNKLDLVTGKNKYTDLPIGIGAEIINIETINWLDKNTPKEFREDPTNYIFYTSTFRRIEGIKVPKSWTESSESITIDTPEDMDKLKRIESMMPKTKPQDWKILEIIGAMNNNEKSI